MGARRRTGGSRRRQRSGGVLGPLVVLAGVGAVAVGAVVLVLGQAGDSPDLEPVRCAAELDGTRWYLSPEQADNAALLAGVALDRGLPARAVTIALATALQESRLENIDHGDRDSVGLFQQRPSQGWGSVDEIMDPVYSTGKFYDGLVKVDGYESLPITEAAQAVQRSGFPDAYAQHEGRSRAWASALTGHSPATITCSLDPADGAGSPEAVVSRARRDLGPDVAVTASEDGASLLLDATGLRGAEDAADRAAWVGAHWAVAAAWALDVEQVDTASSSWVRGRGAHTWSDATDEDGTQDGLERPGPGQVRIWFAPR